MRGPVLDPSRAAATMTPLAKVREVGRKIAPPKASLASADIQPSTLSTANPLGSLAIPLGIAGLGGLWQVMRTALSAPSWPAETFFAIGTTLWLVLTAAYLARGIRRPGSFSMDREHAVYGPFVAYIPVIGILLSAHYAQYIHNVGRIAVVVFVVALGIQAAQLLAYWLRGHLPSQTFHPGYLLPTVAGPFIASIGLSTCGWHQAARSALGIGVFFWFVIGSLIFSRLFAGPRLPETLRPSLSLLVSPPATAGLAWLLTSDGEMGSVGYGLLGILFLMLFVQVLFLPDFRFLSFSTNFWAFTFPVAASASFVVRWLSSVQFPYWRVWCWCVAGFATAVIVAIAGATLRDISGKHARASRALSLNQTIP
jgi:tellurite resistance protein